MEDQNMKMLLAILLGLAATGGPAVVSSGLEEKDEGTGLPSSCSITSFSDGQDPVGCGARLVAIGQPQTNAITVDSSRPSEASESTVIHVGDTSFTADRVLFRSADDTKAGKFICTLAGHAKLTLFTGDIEITADQIELEMGGGEDGPLSLRCAGACTFKQDDNSGEILSGDNLTFGQDGLMITGNATIQYGSDRDKTVVTGDALTAGKDGYSFSGKVTLRHGH
jgi:hypothetical protein